MNCQTANELIEGYVNGELPLPGRVALRLHLRGCRTCYERYEGREPLRGRLRALPMAGVPDGLPTRIKLAISGRHLQIQTPAWRIHWRNMMRPLALPAVGGVLSAVLLFGALMTNLVFPKDFADDIPVRLFAHEPISSPSLTNASPFVVSRHIMVEAFIDYQGEVYDYRVIRMPAATQGLGGLEGGVRGQLENALLTAQFEPATSFGRPVLGRTLIAFQPVTSVTVRG